MIRWSSTARATSSSFVVITPPSPGATPGATRAMWSAAVPDVTASACFAPTYSANRRSRSAVRGAVVSQPERCVSVTASISSSPIAGGWKERKVSRRVPASDESFCIAGEKAYALRCAIGPRDGFLAGVAECEHRTGAVAAAAELAELMAWLAVAPRPDDATRAFGGVETLDGLEHARPGDEEANTGASDLLVRNEGAVVEPFSERRCDGDAVQVHADRRLAELRVVPAAESRGELAHPRPVLAEEHLRVRGPVLDS